MNRSNKYAVRYTPPRPIDLTIPCPTNVIRVGKFCGWCRATPLTVRTDRAVTCIKAACGYHAHVAGKAIFCAPDCRDHGRTHPPADLWFEHTLTITDCPNKSEPV